MRIYLYLLSGICSASIGWNIGQFFLSDLLSEQEFLYTNPEIILFPCVAVALAIGMVSNEILLSNPTRWKLAARKALISLPIAFGLGLIIGLGSGLLFQLLLIFSFPSLIARMLGWLVIGLAVGFAEGITWFWRSIEAGNKQRYQQRIRDSLRYASAASVIAAIFFELARSNPQGIAENLKLWEDFIGFCILGSLLGLAFSLSSSPSYMVALRAGQGFEWRGEEESSEIENYPVIRTDYLQFVGINDIDQNEDKKQIKYEDEDEDEDDDDDDDDDKKETEDDDERDGEIEEGLSIQLPSKGKIIIGSPDNKGAHICLPGVEKNMGYIQVEGNKAYFKATKKGYSKINIGGIDLTSSKEPKTLKHNTIITIKTSPLQSPSNPEPEELEDDDTSTTNTTDQSNYEDPESMPEAKIYRFVYYNRFLDPQA